MARDVWKLAGILILAGMLVGAARGSLRAQPGARHDQVASAKERYERGSAHHDRGEYDAAAVEYLAAYELSRAPKLLFNIAQAHRLAGRRAEALSYYEQYLALEPDGELAALSKTLLDELRQALAEDKAMSKMLVNELRQALAEDKAADEQPATDWARPMRISGIASAGAGFVALGIGVRFGIRAQNLESTLDSVNRWKPEHMKLHEEGEAANRNMVIMYGIGGIALAAGATLYYIGRAKERDAGERDIAIVPVIGSGAAGVAACIDI